MLRWTAVLFLLLLLVFVPNPAAGQALDLRHAGSQHTFSLRLADVSTKPLFTVGIDGGFTGMHMIASVYRDGRVLSVRQGAGRSRTITETRVPLSRGALKVVLEAAVRGHALAIPRTVQDAVFGADVPVLSFSIATNRGVRSVHVMGMEGSHPAGSQAFFPIWSLLYAIAGYPPQVH